MDVSVKQRVPIPEKNAKVRVLLLVGASVRSHLLAFLRRLLSLLALLLFAFHFFPKLVLFDRRVTANGENRIYYKPSTRIYVG